jgi:hypothetical protein
MAMMYFRPSEVFENALDEVHRLGDVSDKSAPNRQMNCKAKAR